MSSTLFFISFFVLCGSFVKFGKCGEVTDLLLFLYRGGNTDSFPVRFDCNGPQPEDLDPQLESFWVMDGFLSYVNTNMSQNSRKEDTPDVQCPRVGLVHFKWTWNGYDTQAIDRAYQQATRIVAELGDFLGTCMVRLGIRMDHAHFICHSLACPVAGVVGTTIERLAGQKLKRISGCDPAGYSVDNDADFARLNSSNAALVDIYYTNRERMGTRHTS
ncbi:Pancreatic triacylglycerol lipase [Folsomia candida]|uniref:Pancreatic triacylglycerol lipase n=1 Tax=Folsomia candida TaxID=158441 RepID=A0A226E4F4_FOLCA|nr:Pancreatic triacylglycerol lipase [Folsomia candida]